MLSAKLMISHSGLSIVNLAESVPFSSKDNLSVPSKMRIIGLEGLIHDQRRHK